MKRVCWCLMVILVGLVLFIPGVLAEENFTSGMDVIILLDCTNSLENENANDAQRMRLDASVMLINMCDFSNSHVAVIPYTWEAYKTMEATGGYGWSEWRDVSDRGVRKELCDNLMRLSTRSGNTDVSPAFMEAERLMAERGDSESNTLVLVLTDGETYSPKEKTVTKANADSVASSRRLREAGAYVYGILLSKDGRPSAEAVRLMEQLVGAPDRQVSGYLWEDVTPDQLKDRFSDVFADMVGTRRRQVPVVVEEDHIVTTVEVSNRSVSEVNIVLPVFVAESDEIEITHDGMAPEEDDYFVYSKGGENQKNSYDFISVKLTKAEPGLWNLSLPAANGAMSGEYTVDVLYNYSIQLNAALGTNSEVYLNDRVHVEAWFVDENQNISSDEFLYRMKDGAPAIPATVSIMKDGKVVFSDLMKNEQLKYVYDLNLEVLRNTANLYGEYSIVIHAEGDELYRSTAPMKLVVGNHAPVGNDSDSLLTFCIDDPFHEWTQPVQRVALNSHFSDQDGDALAYSYECTVNGDMLNVSMENNELVIEPREGASGEASILVTATDTFGAQVQKELKVSIVSIQEVLRNGLVQGRLAVRDGAQAAKGATLGVEVQYDLTSIPEELFGEDDLKRTALVSFMVDGQQMPTLTDDSGNHYFELACGNTERVYQISGKVNVGEIEVLSLDTSVVTYNHAPVCLMEDGSLNQTIDVDAQSEWQIDLESIFADEDCAIAGGEVLTYSQSVETISDNNGWNNLALKVLRLLGQLPRTHTGPMLTAQDGTSMYFGLMDIGTDDVYLTVCDADGAEATCVVRLTTKSAKTDLACCIVYAVMAALCIALLSLLFYWLIYRQKWPNEYMSGRVNGFTRSVNGKEKWPIGLRGRRKMTMNDLYRFRDRTSSYNKTVTQVLEAIKVWPVIGNRLVIKLKGSKPAELVQLQMGGKTDLLKRKGKWGIGVTLVAVVKVAGEEIKLEWRRETK